MNQPNRYLETIWSAELENDRVAKALKEARSGTVGGECDERAAERIQAAHRFLQHARAAIQSAVVLPADEDAVDVSMVCDALDRITRRARENPTADVETTQALDQATSRARTAALNLALQAGRATGARIAARFTRTPNTEGNEQ